MKLPHNLHVDPDHPQERRSVNVVLIVAIGALTLATLAFAVQISADMRAAEPTPAITAAPAREPFPTMPPTVDVMPSEEDKELELYAAHGS